MGRTNIYYFTGTGNSLKIARDIKDKMNDTNLIRICNESIGIIENQSERIGIVFPVYYYGLPVMVKEFINKLVISPDTYIFAIATCGGSVGVAMKQLERLFLTKELKLGAGFKIQMPDNYQVLYGPPPENKQRQYFKKQEELMDEIIEAITKKQQLRFYEKGKYLTKIFGGVLSSTFEPKQKDKHFWTDESCNGCRSCAIICPSKNIKMINDKPTWLHQCELCLGCMQWCPKKSIQYKKGTIKRERYNHPEIKIQELFRK